MKCLCLLLVIAHLLVSGLTESVHRRHHMSSDHDHDHHHHDHHHKKDLREDRLLHDMGALKSYKETDDEADETDNEENGEHWTDKSHIKHDIGGEEGHDIFARKVDRRPMRQVPKRAREMKFS
uniref:Secreted protein n=1 Tax=Mesocestoides corti TaxID=53468 RepID=A0A5K3FND7_MESCO